MTGVSAAGQAIGVDIGGSKVLAVRYGPGGVVEASVKLPTPGEAEGVVATVLAAADLVAPEGQDASRIPLGVGCPGMIDRKGVPHYCPHLHCLDGVPFRDLLAQRRPGAPTMVVNDATAACWAEHLLGAGRGAQDMVMATLGTGIGGGAVLGGRLVEGGHGFAGEIGHMVVDANGPPCPCGKRGCWERFASGSGLGRLAREAALAGELDGAVDLAGGDPESVRSEHVTALALQGDAACLAVMGRFAWWVALGLANLANALDPGLIVVGGGLVESHSVLMGPLRDAFAELVEAPGARSVSIVPAELGERAGGVGAALLVLAGVFRPAPAGQLVTPAPGAAASLGLQP